MHRLFFRGGFSAWTTGAQVRRTMELLAHVDFRTLDNARTALRASTPFAACEEEPMIEVAVAEELAAVVPENRRGRIIAETWSPVWARSRSGERA